MAGIGNSPALLSSGTAILPALGIDGQRVGEEGFSPGPMLLHNRCGIETALSCSQLQCWLNHTSTTKTGSFVLPRRVTVSALPSVVAGGGQGQLLELGLFKA